MKKLLFGVFMFVGLLQATFAQTPATGTIKGRITDDPGAVVPNVTVLLKRLVKDGFDTFRETRSDDGGEYVFTGIPFGVYEVEVKATWVGRTFTKRVELTSSQPARLDIVVSFSPCFEERGSPVAAKLTDADHAEIIRVLIESRVAAGEKIILSPVNISEAWLTPQQRLRVTIMNRSAIQDLTEKKGSLTYYWFTKPAQIGSCIDISLVDSVTVKGQIEDANMAGGFSSYECRKKEGKWTCLRIYSAIS